MSRRDYGDRVKEGHEHNEYWREDLNACHNPTHGCWCCVCKGFMCGCSCHKEKPELIEVPTESREFAFVIPDPRRWEPKDAS